MVVLIINLVVSKMTDFEPIVRQWYKNLDGERIFRVVAIDEASGTLELQYFDGELEELDAADWPNLVLELAEAPEDATAPYDDIEKDDLGYTDDDKHITPTSIDEL